MANNGEGPFGKLPDIPFLFSRKSADAAPAQRPSGERKGAPGLLWGVGAFIILMGGAAFGSALWRKNRSAPPPASANPAPAIGAVVSGIRTRSPASSYDSVQK